MAKWSGIQAISACPWLVRCLGSILGSRCAIHHLPQCAAKATRKKYAYTSTVDDNKQAPPLSQRPGYRGTKHPFSRVLFVWNPQVRATRDVHHWSGQRNMHSLLLAIFEHPRCIRLYDDWTFVDERRFLPLFCWSSLALAPARRCPLKYLLTKFRVRDWNCRCNLRVNSRHWCSSESLKFISPRQVSLYVPPCLSEWSKDFLASDVVVSLRPLFKFGFNTTFCGAMGCWYGLLYNSAPDIMTATCSIRVTGKVFWRISAFDRVWQNCNLYSEQPWNCTDIL